MILDNFSNQNEQFITSKLCFKKYLTIEEIYKYIYAKLGFNFVSSSDV